MLKCKGRGENPWHRNVCESNGPFLPGSCNLLNLRQSMPRMKEVAGQHGFPHEHSSVCPLAGTCFLPVEIPALCFFHPLHIGVRAWRTIKYWNGFILENKQQQWLSKENLLIFFLRIMGKQRKSNHQVQKSGSGGHNHIPSKPYKLPEKSTHYFSLAFSPPYRKGLVTVQKHASVFSYWYCALRSKDKRSFRSAVR